MLPEILLRLMRKKGYLAGKFVCILQTVWCRYLKGQLNRNSLEMWSWINKVHRSLYSMAVLISLKQMFPLHKQNLNGLVIQFGKWEHCQMETLLQQGGYLMHITSDVRKIAGNTNTSIMQWNNGGEMWEFGWGGENLCTHACKGKEEFSKNSCHHLAIKLETDLVLRGKLILLVQGKLKKCC